jgi:hypothetical protein
LTLPSPLVQGTYVFVQFRPCSSSVRSAQWPRTLSSLFRPRGTFQSTPICGLALPFEHSRVEIAFDARFSFPASPALFSGLIRIVLLLAPIASSLAGRSLPPGGFDLSEPLLKRFSPEENPSADSHRGEVWYPSNFAIDNVAEVGSRTSDERGCLGQIQDLGHTCVLELHGAFRFAKGLWCKLESGAR